MKIILIVTLLVTTVAFALSTYYVMTFNELNEAHHLILSRREDLIQDMGGRWNALYQLIRSTKDDYNAEERVLVKMVENYRPLSKESSKEDINRSEYYYQDTLNQYLTVIGSERKSNQKELTNGEMVRINQLSTNVLEHKNIYNKSVKEYNDSIQKGPTSKIAKMAGFGKHEII